MDVKIEKQENNTVKLDITVDAETASQEYSKTCKKVSESVNIPGFRRGKAPRNVVEKHVGIGRIKREALNRMLPNIFANVISENKFNVASEPYVESFDYEVGKPANIIAKIELKPDVKIDKYKDISVDVEKYTTPEDALEKELSNLAQRFITTETVTDRNSTDKDIVVIDFDGTVDGETIKSGSAKNYSLDLEHSNFIEGFAPQLVGHAAGEEFDINVTFPENYHDETLKGKPAVFKIKINEIKQKNVPEITDELAQKVGPFQTVDELKKDIESYLKRHEEMENKNRAQNKILETIIENAQVDIPDSMINREAKLLMEDIKNKVTANGTSWEQFLDLQGQENIWNNLREEAQKRIKNSLVLEHISKVENIKLEDDAIEKKVSEMAKMYNTDEKTVYNQMSKNPQILQSLIQQLISQNIIDFLVENNKVNYVTK